MASSPTEIFWLTIVAILWGGTNPLIKKGGQGIEKIKKSNFIHQMLAEIWFLCTNWRYLIPFALNQSGSLVYYLTLASADISLAVPIANCLTFIFTALCGRMIGERALSTRSYLGIALVTIGVAICVWSKIETSTDK